MALADMHVRSFAVDSVSSMLPVIASCLLSVSRLLQLSRSFGVKIEVAAVAEYPQNLATICNWPPSLTGLPPEACYSRVVSASSEVSVNNQARVADHTAGPTAATLGSIQTASRHPGPWDTLGLVGARAGLNRARPHAHTPAGMHRARAVLRRLDSVS